MRVSLLFVSLGLCLGVAACSLDRPADKPPVICFPDVGSDGSLPLDPAAGFPFRAAVSYIAPLPASGGGLAAHVWIPTSNADVPAVVLDPLDTTDTPASCFTDAVGSDEVRYVGLVTLLAPAAGSGSDVVLVGAAVEGSVTFATATIRAPEVVVATPVVATTWAGGVAQYDVCVETSASSGSIDLVADDPSALAGVPVGAGALVSGPCPNSSGQSHADFVLDALATSLPITASLHGAPAGVPDGWSAQFTVPNADTNALRLTAAAPVVASATPLVGGVVADLSVSATAGSTSVSGLVVSFSGAAFSPPTAVTQGGNAVSSVFVAFGSAPLAIITTPGAASVTVSLAGVLPALVIGTPVVTTVAGVSSITTTLTAGGVPVQGLVVTATAIDPPVVIAPGTVSSDATGQATVFAKLGGSTTIEISVAGQAQQFEIAP